MKKELEISYVVIIINSIAWTVLLAVNGFNLFSIIAIGLNLYNATTTYLKLKEL